MHVRLFFLINFFFFFLKFGFNIKKIGLKFQIDILEKMPIRTWERDPPIIEKPGLGRKYP